MGPQHVSAVDQSKLMTTIKEFPFDFSDLINQKKTFDAKKDLNRIDETQSQNNGIDNKSNQLNGFSVTEIERHGINDKLKPTNGKIHETDTIDLPENPEMEPVTLPHPILTSFDSPQRKISNNERKISGNERKVSIMTDPPFDKDASAETNGRLSAHHAEGPSRRKSNLHNAVVTGELDTSWERPHIEGKFKKYSTTSSIYSKKALSLSQHSEYVERSWWYACCQKCHQEDTGIPSWEPPHWQKVCPYPFCPSYRRIAQTATILLIGVIIWLNIWMIMGNTAGPGGQLFMLALLTIAAHLGGWLILKATTLPTLIGMLIVGVLFKNVGIIHFDTNYHHVLSFIRKIALTILLVRAGMDLDPHALKKHFFTVIKLSLVPWAFEFVLCSVMAYYLLDIPWDWAFLLGSIVAAVSPAVIVPCLMRLRRKGYGVSKGIPTLVLAVSGIDDAASVAVFGIVFSIMFSSSSLTMTIVQGPLSVVIGTIFGIALGYLAKYMPERNDAFLVPLRVLFLLFGGIICMLGFEEIGWGGAGPLAVITFAFVANKNWSDLGWEFEDNPVVTAFEIFWMFFEPMLFSVTGAQVDISELPVPVVLTGGGILIACAILRAILTSVTAVRSNLNMKEKVFVGLSWMAKATVQAALGPVALDQVNNMKETTEWTPELHRYAEIVATVCILSIIITAPIGAIVITFTGPRLLSRTTKPPILEGWRRSNRPSIRDISIIDEEDVTERDAEVAHQRPETPHAIKSTEAPAPITTQPNHSS